MSSDQQAIYKKAIANFLQVEDKKIMLFWKGRVALYAILKALGIKEGDEVILPAFTCVVVPNAIIYLGAKPVYVDIDASTFNIDIQKLEEAITPKTKVIIAQNTFGLAPNITAILDIAAKHNIETIEDCTHGMGGFYNQIPNGTHLKASFFSTQWNKPYSTGIGGIAYINDEVLRAKVQQLEKQATKPSFKENLSLSILIWVRKNLITPTTYWLAVNTYRWLSKKNIITGSSQGEELESPSMPSNFLKASANTQAKKGSKEITKLNQTVSHQRNIAEAYDEALRKLNIHKPSIDPKYFHTYLKYPLLVKNKEQFIQAANDHKIELGEWFNSPIHPIQKDFELWQYHWGHFPIAEKMSQHIVNLPTGNNIDKAYLMRIIQFLNTQKDNLLTNT